MRGVWSPVEAGREAIAFEQRLLVGRQVQRQHLLDAARPVTELRTVGKAILLTTEAVCTKRKTAAGKGRRFLKIT